MNISWDASKGQAPWTVTVAPLNQVPTSVQLPASYLPSTSDYPWTWSWDVPYFGQASELIVAVSDASGKYAGTSAFKTITGSGSCRPPTESLDFVFLLPHKAPPQCGSYSIEWEEDKGNLGLEPPVSLVIFPEEDVPTTFTITSQKANSFDWTVNYKQGAKLTFAMYDQGKSGTGGVADLYTVASGSSKCLGQSQSGATAVLAGASTNIAHATFTPGASRMVTMVGSSTSLGIAASDGLKDAADPSAASDSDDSKGAAVGAAVGGTLGALVVMALLVGGTIVWRRRQGVNDGRPRSTTIRHTWVGPPKGDSPYGNGPDVAERNGMMAEGATSNASLANQSTAALQRQYAAVRMGANEIRPRTAQRESSMTYGRSVYSVVPDDALFPPINHGKTPTPGTPVGGQGAGVGTYDALARQLPPGSSPTHGQGTSPSSYFPQQPPNVNATPGERFVPPLPDLGSNVRSERKPAASTINTAEPGPVYHPPMPRSPRQMPGPSRDDWQFKDSYKFSNDSLVLAEQQRRQEQEPHTRSGAPGSRSGSSTEFPAPRPAALGHDSNEVRRIPPPAPASTSVFDPYSHMSRLYSAGIGARIAAAGLDASAPPVPSLPTEMTTQTKSPRNAAPLSPAASRERERSAGGGGAASPTSDLSYLSSVPGRAFSNDGTSSPTTSAAGSGSGRYANGGGTAMLMSLEAQLEAERRRAVSGASRATAGPLTPVTSTAGSEYRPRKPSQH